MFPKLDQPTKEIQIVIVVADRIFIAEPIPVKRGLAELKDPGCCYVKI
jgi:hypothetical protein